MITSELRRPLRAPGRRHTRPADPAPAAGWKVTGLRVLRSEWAKFWSLRSSWITLGVALGLLVVIGAIASATYSPAAATASGPPAGLSSGGATTAVSLALTGLSFASLAMGVLGG